jgi:hypothetical protein
MFKMFLLTVAALAASTTLADAAESNAASAAFARLGTLVGTWSGRSDKGKVHTVSFRRTAADSVLWKPGRSAPAASR